MATLRDIKPSIMEVSHEEALAIVREPRYKRQIPGPTSQRTARKIDRTKGEKSKALKAIASLSQEEINEILQEMESKNGTKPREGKEE